MANFVGGQDGNIHDVPDSRGGGRPAADAGGAGNMGASVTPHVLITETEGVQFVSCGLDSLDLSCAVVWSDFYSVLAPKLREGKDRAQREDRPYLFAEYLCGPVSIYPTGRRPNYAYHLATANMHLFIANSEDGERFQNVFVSFKSQALWSLGVRKLVEELSGLIVDLGGVLQDDRLCVSRCDLCSDWIIPTGLSFGSLESQGITRNRKKSLFLDGKALETYYIGSKTGPIQARIYNKSREIEKSRKDWFFEVWEIDPCDCVWRVEFQLRRQALKSYGVNSIDDLFGLMAGIWRDLTENWYCLRLPDNLNVCRRSLNPWWAMVQACAPEFGPLMEAKRIVRQGGKAGHDYYLKRASNLFLIYCAILGFHDLGFGLNDFSESIRNHWEDPERDFENARLLKTIELGKLFERAGSYDDIPF